MDTMIDRFDSLAEFVGYAENMAPYDSGSDDWAGTPNHDAAHTVP